MRLTKILFVAFHFPPMNHSSGVQRSLGFVRHLPDFDWQPLVLSAHPRAYQSTGAEQLANVPVDVGVNRAQAFDAARHFSLFGRYPRLLATPDRWGSWLPFALHAGRRLITQHRPAAILSTYPIATAHLIGMRLAQWSGLPWVADFRDSMYDDEYPSEPHQRTIYQRLDQEFVSECRRAVFTTEAARALYAGRYPDLPAKRWLVIPNGYEETDFAGLESVPVNDACDRRLVLLHSGIIYPVERNPLPFLRALARLRTQPWMMDGRLRVRFRATGHDDFLRPVIRDLQLEDVVELAPAVAYRAALREMASVDALLLLQGGGCNHQMPAKVYEYLRAGRPILGLTDTGGETAALLREVDADNLLPLEDEDELVALLPELVRRLLNGSLKIAPADRATRFSRRSGTHALATMLDELV